MAAEKQQRNRAGKFAPFESLMKGKGQPEIAILNFKHYYQKFCSQGEDGGFVREAELSPIEQLPNAEKLTKPSRRTTADLRKRTVMIKLNGGLGTTIGLSGPKSMLVVKENYTFLDVIAQQALRADVPLVLMNSFNTERASLEALGRYRLKNGEIPKGFLQHQVPRIRRSDYSPAEFPDDENLGWCPPGHGDLYPALVSSGLLGILLKSGYQYAFVSNADNLSASLDDAILGYFVGNNLDFLMEACDREERDRKGGHLANGSSPSGFLLRESAQCHADDRASFQCVQKHKYFNTNNLWIRLEAVRRLLDEKRNILDLPMIVNPKILNPNDRFPTPVYQLETAMGAAIQVFEKADAIRVSRSRFAPVKTSDDLDLIRSDKYRLTKDFRLVKRSWCFDRLAGALAGAFGCKEPTFRRSKH